MQIKKGATCGGVSDMAMEEMPLWDLRNAHFATLVAQKEIYNFFV